MISFRAARWRSRAARRSLPSSTASHRVSRQTPTGLAGLLNERGLRTVYLAGLALDFCVAWSALDARLRGFDAIVIDDACRPIDAGGSLVAARKAFADAFVRVVTADSLR
jgi:nicotinamidase/pyrazinamidase